MRNWFRGVGSSLLIAAGAVLVLGAPTASATGKIFSWRTADGGYAFADDIDAVPLRYRDQVSVRRAASISEYRRYTPEDEAATDRYEEGLADRVEDLRQRNSPPAPEGYTARPRSGDSPDYVTVRSGSRRGIDISTPSLSNDAPLQIETIRMRRRDGLQTQPVRVTRRGDKIISVEKSRDRWYGLDEVMEEDEVDALLER